jgi:hypothetical protein
VASFIGDETLLTSLKRLAWARGMRLDLTAGVPIFPDAGADRRWLARIAATAIGESTCAAGIGSRDISRVAVPLAPLAMR